MTLRYIVTTIIATATLTVSAQKITLGSCTMKDGGQYQGEMQAGKPHGKGKTVWKDGDVFEGEYVHGKRQGYRHCQRLQKVQPMAHLPAM